MNFDIGKCIMAFRRNFFGGGINMGKTDIRGAAALFAAAVIWGLAFAFQSAGMEYIGPFTFTVIRNIIGSAALLPLALLNKEKSESNRTLVSGGIICGVMLGAASCLQQYGMVYTTAGKAGFLTAMYIVMIPLAGLLIGKKCPRRVYPAVALAAAGMYLLCMNGSFSLNRGDAAELMCAAAFTAQIIAVSHFSSRVNAYKFACIEFAAAAAAAAVPALMTESVTISAVKACRLPLLYTGIMSSGAGYTLQIIGQRRLDPTVAALIMSLESCVSAIGGWLILNQSLTAREIAGCAVMFAAIILAQLPERHTPRA